MRHSWLPLALAATLLGARPTAAAELLDVKVLYAGHPGSDREEDFRSFLRAQVRQVATTDFRTFTVEQARDYDVILFDWTSIYPRDHDGRIASHAGVLDIPTPPRLPTDFDRPAILIGHAGGSVADALRLKAAGLCLCLEGAAHDIAASHEIFRGPFPVDLRFDDCPLPPQYRDEPASSGGILLGLGLLLIVAAALVSGVRFVLRCPAIAGLRSPGVRTAHLAAIVSAAVWTPGVVTTCAGVVCEVARHRGGETLKVWKVQDRAFPAIDPGLIYDPDGFEDSPDTERIASGLNSKNPRAIALARQGSFFLWGFSASPTDMTPEARKLFLNAVAYIRKFDGQTPLVHRDRPGGYQSCDPFSCREPSRLGLEAEDEDLGARQRPISGDRRP